MTPSRCSAGRFVTGPGLCAGVEGWTPPPLALATFKEYPPSQASGTLSVEKALTMLQEGTVKN